jgi:hypothetical protein
MTQGEVMQDYSTIIDELKTISKEERAFRERYKSALKHLKNFDNAKSSLPILSIDNEIIKIDFIGKKYQVEFRYSRKNGTPSGEICISRGDGDNKNEIITSQEFEVNGDVKNTSLSLTDDIETMAAILNLVKSAVES